MTQVDEIMTPNPERVEVTDSLREVVSRLMELDVRHLPVVSNDELIGMISDRDLRTVAGVTPGVTRPEDVAWDRAVTSIMQGDVIAVEPSDDLRDAVDLMIEHKVGALPVVDGVNGMLVGIVSYIDVLRHAREMMEEAGEAGAAF